MSRGNNLRNNLGLKVSAGRVLVSDYPRIVDGDSRLTPFILLAEWGGRVVWCRREANRYSMLPLHDLWSNRIPEQNALSLGELFFSKQGTHCFIHLSCLIFDVV